MIRKVSGGYVVVSESGKRLSKPMSKREAHKRLGQIEYFKHRDAKKSHRKCFMELGLNYSAFVEKAKQKP